MSETRCRIDPISHCPTTTFCNRCRCYSALLTIVVLSLAWWESSGDQGCFSCLPPRGATSHALDLHHLDFRLALLHVPTVLTLLTNQYQNAINMTVLFQAGQLVYRIMIYSFHMIIIIDLLSNIFFCLSYLLTYLLLSTFLYVYFTAKQ